MTFLPHAQNLSINGGDFSEVNGNQNHYYDHTNPLNMHGDNNSTTFVGGPYHNGPDNSITNEAGGDMHIIGQGEDCQVNMGSMDGMPSPPEESSKSSTQQHNTRTPVARSNASNHQRSNNGISNRAGGNLNVIGQGPGSRVQIGNNAAHLAQQSMWTRNVMCPPVQKYGVEDGYSSQNLHPSQSQYGANFQHQMRSQHAKGWCNPTMEYYPQSTQQATFNRSVPSSPPPEVYRANSPSQMTGHPSGNFQYDWHHHNVPSSPPIGYPPPTSPPPSQATSYLAENDQFMGYHAPPHSGLSSSPPAPQLPTTRYSSDNNQYAPYESRPSRSLAATTSAPPTQPLPSEPVRAPVQSPPGTLSVNPAPARAPPSTPISVPVLPQSHQPLPNTTPTPSAAPVEQGSRTQESATVGVVAPATVLSPAGIKDTPPSPLPVDTVPVIYSNGPRQEEQPPLAAPRPLVGGASTNILNPMPASPSSAPSSANQALPAPVTQRVELNDALRPPFIKNTSSQVSASTLVAESASAESHSPAAKSLVERQDAHMTPTLSPSTSTLVQESVPAKPEETSARVGNGSINSDSNSPNANVTENALPGSSKIVPTSQQVLPEQADTSSRTEIPNDNLMTNSTPKAKKWRRLVNYIKRQVKKLGRRRSGV